MLDLKITRAKAFGTHLALSLLIFLGVMTLIVFYWYPFPLFSAEGGWKGVRIMIFVDIVLGPVLTLVVFKPGKAGLKLDMSLILTCQLVALTWGFWVVYSARPIVLVFVDGEFHSVSYEVMKELPLTEEQKARYMRFEPTLVYVDTPEGAEEFADFLQMGRKKYHNAIWLAYPYYRSYKDNLDKVFARGIDIEKYVAGLPDLEKELTKFKEKKGEDLSSYVFLPMIARYHQVMLVLDKESTEMVDLLQIPYLITRAR